MKKILPLVGFFAVANLALLAPAASAAEPPPPPPSPGIFFPLPMPGPWAAMFGPFAGQACQDPGALPFAQDEGDQQGQDHHGPGKHGERAERPDPRARLAMRLAAAEVVIGIRADQLDLWRDYTDALMSLLPPPPPAEKPPVVENEEPFARVEHLAQLQIERGEKAVALQQAIGALKAKLTPEQLERLRGFEARDFPGPR